LTTVTTPLPQWQVALARADEVRIARARLKRAIAAGERTVAEVLAEAPDYTANMPVAELLQAQHRWGRRRVMRLLNSLAIHERRTVGRLTERQKRAIIDALGEAA